MIFIRIVRFCLIHFLLVFRGFPGYVVSGALVSELDYPSLLRILRQSTPDRACILMEDRAMWLGWRKSNVWLACLAVRKWKRVDLAMSALAQQCQLKPLKAVVEEFVPDGLEVVESRGPRFDTVDRSAIIDGHSDDRRHLLTQAFYEAVRSGCLPVAKYLLEQGANIHGYLDVGDDPIAWSPFMVAVDQGNLEMIQWLAGQGATWEAPEYNPLMDRPPNSAGFQVRLCLTSRSALDRAAVHGHVEVVRWLLRKYGIRTIQPISLGCAVWSNVVEVLKLFQRSLRGHPSAPSFWIALDAVIKLDRVDMYHHIVPAHLAFDVRMLMTAVVQNAKRLVAAMINMYSIARSSPFVMVKAIRTVTSSGMFCVCAAVLPWKVVAWVYPQIAVQSMEMLRLGLDQDMTSRCLREAHSLLPSSLVKWQSSRGLLHERSAQQIFEYLLDSPRLLDLTTSVPMVRYMLRNGLPLEVVQARYDELIARLRLEPNPDTLLDVQSEREALLLLQVGGVRWRSEEIPLLFFRMFHDGSSALLATVKEQGFDANDPKARLLAYATELGRVDMVEFLLDLVGSTSEEQAEEAFQVAANTYHLETCQVLMARGVISLQFILEQLPRWPESVQWTLTHELQRQGHTLPDHLQTGRVPWASTMWKWLSGSGNHDDWWWRRWK